MFAKPTNIAYFPVPLPHISRDNLSFLRRGYVLFGLYLVTKNTPRRMVFGEQLRLLLFFAERTYSRFSSVNLLRQVRLTSLSPVRQVQF